MDELKKIPKNFCVMPFLGGIIKTDGTIGVCCNISNAKIKNPCNIKNNTYLEWKVSNYRKNLQNEFLSGKSPINCSRCWNQENLGKESLRQSKNKHYKLNYFKTIESFLIRFPLNSDPIEWEMQITNLCNLKCQMCSGKDSSKLLVENKKIFPSTSIHLNNEEKKELYIDQKMFDIDSNGLENIKNILNEKIKEINFRGGEPLIIPKIEDLLGYIVQKGYAKNLILQITTNGTIINDKILELLKKFKRVRLMISIESTNKQNDYIRFPSQWQTVENNIKTYKLLKNVEFFICATVSNLSLMYIDQLIHFSIKNNFYTKLEIIDSPNYMHFSILPVDLLERSLKKLMKIKNNNVSFLKIENLNALIKLLKLEINKKFLNEDKWNKFKKIIQLRDMYRKVHIKDYMPELAKYIYT